MPMLSNNATPFWLVWNPNGRNPTFRHAFEENAIREAERLARDNPGETFVVLASVAARSVSDMQRLDLRPPRDDIPF